MMVATILEKINGTDFANDNIYSSWWFVLLWAALAICSSIYIIRCKLHKRAAVMLLHASFLVILSGALTTYLTVERGMIHLRKGEQTKVFMTDKGEISKLPFALCLEDFNIEYYPGTDAPLDYVSMVKIEEDTISISMNNIGTHAGYRFFQSSYDSDGEGTTLGVAYDVWGIAITYTGYAMLLLSMVWILLSRKTKIRNLYHKAVRPVGMILLSMFALSATAHEHKLVEKDIARDFGSLYTLYNTRICPVNTLATDFVTKLSGKSSWNGCNADEILVSWMFYFTDWEHEPLIRIKDKHAQELLGIKGEWASYDDFWDSKNIYKLEQPLRKAYMEGDNDEVKHLRDADEKFNLIRMFYSGELLRLFPYPSEEGSLTWIAPGAQNLPKGMEEEEWFFVRKTVDYINESIVTGDNDKARELIGKIAEYQKKRGADLLPNASMMNAERLYNNINGMRVPVFIFLTLGIIGFIIFCYRTIQNKAHSARFDNIFVYSTNMVTFIAFMMLTLVLGLRWYISGHLPLSNGYETMQFMAWATLLLTLTMQSRFVIILAFGPLLAGLSLLVALLGESNPQITQLMPVLQSPLLSIHVMVIMLAYSLFGIMMLLGFMGMALYFKERRATDKVLATDFRRQSEQLATLSQLLLYPAVFLLTTGIFIGAVWANVSWGRYWGWDSKEVWALITMLIYAMPLHSDSIKAFKKAENIHLYMILAFLSVLMTYFGVNFILGGMHSYA